MALRSILGARNIPLPGGMFEADGKNLTIAPSGEFKSEQGNWRHHAAVRKTRRSTCANIVEVVGRMTARRDS
jgi:hypothetical protein